MSTRARAGVAVAIAAAVAVGAAPSSTAAKTPDTWSAANPKLRAVHEMVRAPGTPATAGSQGDTTALGPARATTRSALTHAARSAGSPVTGSPASPGEGAASADTCTNLGMDWVPTHDRVWLLWNSVGANDIYIYRRTYGAKWQFLGTATGTSYLDRTINPRSLFTYRIVTQGGDCVLPQWVTMGTADGWGVPDVIYGASSGQGWTGPLMMQDTYGYAMQNDRLYGMDPAFSPDGRQLATADFNGQGDSWLRVSWIGQSGVDGVRVSNHLSGGVAAAEPAWSPDGTRIAYTSYSVDPDTQKITGSELHLMDSRTGADTAVTGSTGLIQPDWRSPSTLVAAGAGAGEGLFTIPASGGTRAPVQGTSHSGFPEVAPDGRTYFVEGDGSTFAVKVLSTSGSASTIVSSTDHYYEQPRVSPDGTLYYMDIDPGDVDDPTDNTFTVMSRAHGTGVAQATSIGAPRPGGPVGFHGYDVRQPKSEGTSDFVGNANDDVLAKDAGGTLWAYPGTPTGLGSRVRIGGGWNAYVSYFAVGDLTNDDRADLVGKDSSGQLWLYAGLGQGRFTARRLIGTGFRSYTLVAPGDLDRDGRADLVAKDSSGVLWKYAGLGTGALGARTRLGAGWNSMTAILGSGDVNLDGKADLLARGADGKLWLFPGDGAGRIGSAVQIGTGWSGFTGLTVTEVTDQVARVFARSSAGVLSVYTLYADGKFVPEGPTRLGSGWNGLVLSS